MAHLVRVKPLGWSLFDILASASMNSVDTNLAKCVNGDEGGIWANATEILYQGDFRVGGLARFDSIGASTLTGTLTVNAAGLVTFHNGSFLTVVAGTTFSMGSTMQVISGAKVWVKSGGTLQLDSGGTATCATAFELLSGGSVTVDSGAAINNLAGGEIFNEGRIVQFGTDASFEHRITELPDANANMGASADVFMVRQNLPTADRTYTLDKTTRVPHDGETCKVSRFNPVSHAALFKREDATLLGQINGDGLQGGFIEFIFHSGDWRVLSWGGASVASVANPAGTY